MTTIRDRPLEFHAFNADGRGREWTGPTHIECSVELTKARRPNKATAKIWNLSRESVSWIESVGSDGTFKLIANDTLLYSGDIDSVRTTVKGELTITEVKGGDGGKQYRDAKLSRSWTKDVTTSTILRVVTAVTGFATDYLGELEEIVYEGGFVAAGNVRDILDDIVTAAGGTWSIQDGVIQILGTGAPTSGGVLLKPGTGLVGSPERKDKGISCKSVLRPELRPGRLFKLESRHIEGWFRVDKSNHDAASDGSKWATTLLAEDP